jgi:hypothetical protein
MRVSRFHIDEPCIPKSQLKAKLNPEGFIDSDGIQIFLLIARAANSWLVTVQSTQ